MFRIILMLLLLAGPLAGKQLIAPPDSLPCDGTVRISKTFCPACEAWNDQFSPDFTDKIPVEYHLSIYNKDSVEIFSTIDLDKGWNGNGKDNFEQTQSFTWEMEYRYEKEGTIYRCRGKLVVIQ